MVGFGGAGPAHAARVARILGVREVIVPPASGAASALGFLVGADQLRARALAARRPRPSFDLGAVNACSAELEAEGARLLREAGVAAADVTVARRAEMRLLGQIHEIAVPLPAGPLAAGSLAAHRGRLRRGVRARATRTSTRAP